METLFLTLKSQPQLVIVSYLMKASATEGGRRADPSGLAVTRLSLEVRAGRRERLRLRKVLLSLWLARTTTIS